MNISIKTFVKNIRGKMNRIGNYFLFGIIGIILFMIGFVISFPADILKKRVQYELGRNLPARFSIAEISFGLPLNISAESVVVRPDDIKLPELKFDSITLSPHFASVLGKLGTDFEALVNKGRIAGSIVRNGAISVDVDTLAIDESVPALTSLRISGLINSARLDSNLDLEPDKPTTINLQAENLKLTGTRNLGLAVEEIALGQALLQVTGEGRNLKINRAVISGGDVGLTATGQLNVDRNVPSTRLNIQVQIKPDESLDPSVRSLLDMFGSPGNNGSRNIRIQGSLARPAMR